MHKNDDDGHRPGPRTPSTDIWRLDRPDLWTPADREKRRAAVKAMLAKDGQELHTTQIGRWRLTECRQVGAPSIFQSLKTKIEGGAS